MLTPEVQPFSVAPSAHPAGNRLPSARCGHTAHVGTCSGCQQRKLTLLAGHNETAIAAARAWQRYERTP
jgi:hypothetical protein